LASCQQAALPLPLPTPTVDVPPLNYTRDGKLLSSGVIGVDAPAAAATVAASNLLTGPHKQSAQVQLTKLFPSLLPLRPASAISSQ